MSKKEEGYGVCRSVEDAKAIAAKAREEGLKGCYPSAAVVLADALQGCSPSCSSERYAGAVTCDCKPTAKDVAGTLEVAAPFDYVAEAMVTMSPSWHGDDVSFAALRNVLAEAIEALTKLDKIKKALFYGRALPENFQPQQDLPIYPNEPETCFTLPTWFEEDKYGEYVIHAIIGAATETGELLEALQKVVINGEAFDEVNMREEVGDVFWYLAALAHTCNFTFEDAQRVNIAKLRARYPNKFTAFDANNRNLNEERRILEGSPVSPCVGHAVASDEEEKISSKNA